MNLLKSVVAASLFVLAACGGPTAFDNATCSTFFVGTWTGATPAGAGGEKDRPAIAMQLEFAQDGKVSLTGTPQGEKAQTNNATWTAGPGTAADQCSLTVDKPNAVTVKDNNTFVMVMDRQVSVEFKRQ